jgi:hypothetical protein
MLPKIRPMRLKLVKEPFDSPEYIFEQKYDDFRVFAYLQNGECKLISKPHLAPKWKPLGYEEYDHKLFICTACLAAALQPNPSACLEN